MIQLRFQFHAFLAIGVLASARPAVAQWTSSPAPTPSAMARTSPVTLRALLDAVRDGHPSLQAAQARIRAAEGARATAGRFGNPTLSYQVENASFLSAAAVPGIDRETMETATIPLEPLYLRGTRVARTTAEVRAARADAERERQRIALDAASAFYRLALADVAASTSRDFVAWLDSLVIYNRARAREGVAAEADLLRTTLERDRAAADATMADAEHAHASAQLAAFLGAPGTTIVAGVATADAPLALPEALDRPAHNDSASTTTSAALMSSVALRPDVRAAREREIAAAASVRSERRMLVREVGATIGTKQMMGTNSMVAGITLPFPLFDQNRGEIARANAERDMARLDLAARERQAYADISGSAAAARLLTERAVELSRPDSGGVLARADEMRRIALGAYREGAIPLVQLLDVARAWGDTRLAFYRTLYAQHQAVLALVVATGGDLFSETSTTTRGASR